MARKSDSKDTGDEVQAEPSPSAEVLTLELKQNAYWAGVFCPQGTRRDFPREEALTLLATTDLWAAVGK